MSELSLVCPADSFAGTVRLRLTALFPEVLKKETLPHNLIVFLDMTLFYQTNSLPTMDLEVALIRQVQRFKFLQLKLVCIKSVIRLLV